MKITETVSWQMSKRARTKYRRLAGLVDGVCRRFNLRSRPHRGYSSIHELVDGGFLGFGGTVLCVIYETYSIRCAENKLAATMIIADFIETLIDNKVDITVCHADEI